MSSRKGIMVIDDNLGALKLVTDILIKEGYSVRPASGGEQALESAAAQQPELILLDMRMPAPDGFEVCRRIKADPLTRDIPVLFLSASADVEERIKGFEAGAIDFIMKPFQRDELLARVRTHLELSRLQTRLETMVERRTEELKVSNERLQRELEERNKAELALKHEKKITDALLESVPGLLYMYNESGYLIKWNKKQEGITGFSPDELARVHYMDWFEGDDRKKIEEGIARMFREGYAEVEAELKIKNGSKIPYVFTAVPLEIENEKYMVGIGIDITNLKNAEKQIKLSLNEKEVLLRELYHRTKNNMQVICSMLKLHSLYTGDAKVLEVFQDMENRICTMSLVHHKLYQSQNLSSIDFSDYVNELCVLLKKSYKVSDDKIKFKINVAASPVLIDIAVPCGLIINELISNSVKYAFPGDNKGEIIIEASRGEDGTVSLLYSDNGVGTPDSFDFKTDSKMGLKTVYSIGQHQLQGTVSFKSVKGVECAIVFQDKFYSSRV